MPGGLVVEKKARGVIPSKVSDLINDLGFVTTKEIENIILANQTGNYTGLAGDEVEVIVDNLNRTIGAKLINSLDTYLRGFLPSSDGEYDDGTYVLKATVVDGKPQFTFVKNDSDYKYLYYYGNTSADLSGITEGIIKSLSNGGEGKGNREYTYSSYKQRQVFAYPAEYGVLSKIEHSQSGINSIGLFERLNLTVNGISYYVYVSSDTSTGEYTYKFIY